MQKECPIFSTAIYKWSLMLGGFTACLLALMVYSTPAKAGGCFPNVYYEMLFKPVLQEAAPGGDSRLQGFSDYLAAKGKDPHHHEGSGCMCGVNNGRWDQGLLNASLQDSGRAPVSFQINRLDLELFTRKDKPQGQPFFLKASAIASCLNRAPSKQEYRGFNHPSGLIAAPGVLEPGENLLGCMCLKPKDRTKTGYVKLKVNYTPLIAASALPGPKAAQQTDAGKTTLRQLVKIAPLGKGQARYFQVKAPAGASASITLSQAQGLALFTADQWQPQQGQWRYGGFEGSLDKQGAVLIMVRALAEQGQGELKIELNWKGPKLQLPAKPLEPRMLSAGPPAARTFKVFMLGTGSKSTSFDTDIKHPCCSGEPR